MKRIVLTTLCVVILNAPFALADDVSDLAASDKAQEWEVDDWINSSPLTLAGLRGKVVLVRWWTGPGCPFCIRSSAALNEFYQEYHDQGLQMVGFYHHKALSRFRKSDVKKMAKDLGFEFPIAIDHDWKTLKRWWLNKKGRTFTSVSFLIDKKGTIQYIHSGGQLVRGDFHYQKMRTTIEKLLKEPF